MDYLKVPIENHEWILNTPERNKIQIIGPPKHADSKLLGKGAYGTVFEAIYREQQVAVKIVKNRTARNGTYNESQILGWKHSNIVQILSVESAGKFGIIIMERVRGQTLQLVLDAIELPLRHRVFISLDILCALCYCHKRGLLHLDVKPQNVMLAFTEKLNTVRKDPRQRSYVCKLCDFGSSLKQNEETIARVNTKGTARYMSPEALRAEPLTPAADIYSLGITMWQLKQRRTPFDLIRCNEVVAFQVVKNDLRPSSDLKRFQGSDKENPCRSQTRTNCRCQHYATESKHQQKVLKENIEMKKHNLTPLISPNIRIGRPGKTLQVNNRGNVVRDLLNDLNFEHFKKIGADDSLKLLSIFEDIPAIKNERKVQAENAYTAVFESCWQPVPEKRLNEAELQKSLLRLLK